MSTTSRERPLLVAGLALITAHLLDLAFSGPATTIPGVLGIVVVPAAWVWARPRLRRPTRVLLAVAVGLLALGFGVVSHGLHVINSGPAWTDVTGIGMIAGGLLLFASAVSAACAPGTHRRRIAGWLPWAGGVIAVAVLVVLPLTFGLIATHAPRWAIQESSLGIPHEEVRIGHGQSAWYVPSRNGAAVLLGHGSGGSRERVVAHIRMLARHGYGVLALDNPGNGESAGHSNGLGDNAQPGVEAALDWLSQRDDVDPRRIAAFGTSLGGEVVLEAAARDPRIRAVVSDGAARPRDASDVAGEPMLDKAIGGLGLAVVRGVSGMRSAPSLFGLMPRIAPRPVLLVASGEIGSEAATNRRYQADGGSNVALWVVPGAGHTAGLRVHPVEYERRTMAFLDEAMRGFAAR